MSVWGLVGWAVWQAGAVECSVCTMSSLRNRTTAPANPDSCLKYIYSICKNFHIGKKIWGCKNVWGKGVEKIFRITNANVKIIKNK